jgi:hypothetical protein
LFVISSRIVAIRSLDSLHLNNLRQALFEKKMRGKTMSIESQEIWKSIPGFDPDYQVSNKGRARSLKCGKERLLKTPKIRKYAIVALYRADGTHTSITLHRALYMAFLGEIPAEGEVDHIDDNPENNAIENLRVVTRQENMAKSWERRRAKGHTAMHKLGNRCKRGHAYDEANTYYNKQGYRFCRACVRVRNLAKAQKIAA